MRTRHSPPLSRPYSIRLPPHLTLYLQQTGNLTATGTVAKRAHISLSQRIVHLMDAALLNGHGPSLKTELAAHLIHLQKLRDATEAQIQIVADTLQHIGDDTSPDSVRTWSAAQRRLKKHRPAPPNEVSSQMVMPDYAA